MKLNNSRDKAPVQQSGFDPILLPPEGPTNVESKNLAFVLAGLEKGLV